MKVIDLFSGLGGFSQAFLDRGHDVVRFDNDEQFKEVSNTIICDVMDLTPEDLCDYLWDKPDIILASPPCNCFSPMTIGHYWSDNIKPHLQERKDHMIDLVKHTLKIIEEADPRYWILENPAGMLKHVIGEPDVLTWWGAWGHFSLKPTHLWGKFPPIDWRPKPKKGTYEEAKRGARAGIQRANLSPADRALVPYDFSLAVCLAAEGTSPQQTLEEYI